MINVIELNNIRIGDFFVDLFICENGNLGITVADKETVDGELNLNLQCKDIFVDKVTYDVTSC